MTTVDHARRLGLLLVSASLLLGYLVCAHRRLLGRRPALHRSGEGDRAGCLVARACRARSITRSTRSRSRRFIGCWGEIGRRTGNDQRRSRLRRRACSLVIPIYLIAWELWERRPRGWPASSIYAVPANGHVLADALSESTFLLFFCLGLWFALRFLRAGAPGGWRLVAASVLAYLTRPEGLVLPASLVVTIVVTACFRRSSCQPAMVWAMVILVLGPLVAAGPFVLLKGGISTKPSIKRILGTGADLLRRWPWSASGRSIRIRPRGRQLRRDEGDAAIGRRRGHTACSVAAPAGIAAGWSSRIETKGLDILGMIVGARRWR